MTSFNIDPNAGTRMERLQKLICGGSWNNKNKINLIYWHPDATAGWRHWVAWVDPIHCLEQGLPLRLDWVCSLYLPPIGIGGLWNARSIPCGTTIKT